MQFITYNQHLFESSITKVNGVILFSDIVGSSVMWRDHQKQMYNSLDKQDNMFSKIINKNKGTLLKTIGDAYMIHFDELIDSINYAIEVQMQLKNKPLKISSKPVQLRIGMCAGPLLSKKNDIQECRLNDYYGNTVNTASRMESKVSEVGGFAFTSLTKFDDKKVKELLDENCTYKVIKFTENAKDIEFKRSGRLLTKTHHYVVKDIEKLKGVDEVEAYQVNLK